MLKKCNDKVSYKKAETFNQYKFNERGEDGNISEFG